MLYVKGKGVIALKNETRKYPLPQMVLGKAKAAGEVGEKWLAELDDTVAFLAQKWRVTIEGVLNGGSHALVCAAKTAEGEACVLKVEIPDVSEAEFMYAISAMRIANGSGYAKLLAFSPELRAALYERLGAPLKQSALTPQAQMQIICEALLKTWAMSIGDHKLPSGADSLKWFGDFIPQAWESLRAPCPKRVIDRALFYINSRRINADPTQFVLLHGDAHNNNALQVPGTSVYKLIDAEGLFYERAYDLGVLMREWPEEYRENPTAAWHARAEFLHRLTGVDVQEILEWGYLQMVATSLILLQIGEEVLGREMLDIAQAWSEEEI